MNIIIIIAVVIIMYARTINYDLVVDDERHYEAIRRGLFDKKTGGWLRNLRERLYSGGTLAYKTKEGWCCDKRVDHLLTTLLHALSCVLIYIAFGSSIISLWAALLYAVHPANNQTAIWLNGRRYQLNVILVLLMIICSHVVGLWALVLYPLMAFLQVNAIFSPLLLGWWGLVAMPFFYLLCRKEINKKIAERKKILHSKDILLFSLRKLIPITKTYGAYFFHMIVPRRVLSVYPHLYYYGMTKEGNEDAYALNEDFLLGVSALCLTTTGLLYFSSHGLGWLFAFMVIATLQWCGFVYYTQMFADRYISLANVFMMFFVSYVVGVFAGANTNVILSGLFCYYVANLNVAMKMYKNIWDFFDYNIYWNPSGARLIENKAARLLSLNDPMGAWEVVKRGLGFIPNNMKLNILAAHCMVLLDDKAHALLYLREAKKHCYIGQEKLVENFAKTMFGFDLDGEVSKIKNKESKLDRRQREEVLKIHDILNADEEQLPDAVRSRMAGVV